MNAFMPTVFEAEATEQAKRLVITTFDQRLIETLNKWQPGTWPVGNLILVLIAVVLSVILCGAIGIEREWKGRSAGLRTHLLVGVGSCVIMIISIYGFPAMFTADKRDVARLAASIITGVGFLGAGAIAHRASGIKGLTTAGTIWIVMAIGIACGSFNFILAIIATIVIVIVLTVFKNIERKISQRNMLIVLTAPTEVAILSKILAVSKEFDCTIHGLSTELINDGNQTCVQCTFQAIFSSSGSRSSEYVARLAEETKASNIHVLNEH